MEATAEFIHRSHASNHHDRTLGGLAGAAIDAIKINSITVERKKDRTMVVKRRKGVSRPIATIANLFFRLVDDPICVCVEPEEWRRWETDCFRLLNGDRFTAFAEDATTVCADKLPGEDLREIASRKALTPAILVAAAKEIRRAHGLWCAQLGGPWSHGDMQLSNVIYDDATGTARLIDFEVMHDRFLPALLRHADDLLVFLQDMMPRVSTRQWVPFAITFLNAYGNPRATEELKNLLRVPTGVGGLWWKIRTNLFRRAEIVSRVEALREALESANSCR